MEQHDWVRRWEDEFPDSRLKYQDPVYQKRDADKKPDREAISMHVSPAVRYRSTMLITTKATPTTMAQNTGRW